MGDQHGFALQSMLSGVFAEAQQRMTKTASEEAPPASDEKKKDKDLPPFLEKKDDDKEEAKEASFNYDYCNKLASAVEHIATHLPEVTDGRSNAEKVAEALLIAEAMGYEKVAVEGQEKKDAGNAPASLTPPKDPPMGQGLQESPAPSNALQNTQEQRPGGEGEQPYKHDKSRTMTLPTDPKLTSPELAAGDSTTALETDENQAPGNNSGPVPTEGYPDKGVFKEAGVPESFADALIKEAIADPFSGFAEGQEAARGTGRGLRGGMRAAGGTALGGAAGGLGGGAAGGVAGGLGGAGLGALIGLITKNPGLAAKYGLTGAEVGGLGGAAAGGLYGSQRGRDMSMRKIEEHRGRYGEPTERAVNRWSRRGDKGKPPATSLLRVPTYALMDPDNLPEGADLPKTGSALPGTSPLVDYVLHKLSEENSGASISAGPSSTTTVDGGDFPGTEAGEGVPPMKTRGQDSMIADNNAAIDYTKREAKAEPKKDLKKVLDEPAQSKATDSKLKENLTATDQAGAKIATAAARELLRRVLSGEEGQEKEATLKMALRKLGEPEISEEPAGPDSEEDARDEEDQQERAEQAFAELLEEAARAEGEEGTPPAPAAAPDIPATV
jgi:uncharacterized protein (DUF2267 family)